MGNGTNKNNSNTKQKTLKHIFSLEQSITYTKLCDKIA